MGERGGLPEAMRVMGREGLVRDQIRPDCPYGEPCAFWVEGYWGVTIEAPGSTSADRDSTLAVRRPRRPNATRFPCAATWAG